MIFKRKQVNEKKRNTISAILIFLVIFYNKDTFPSIYHTGSIDTIFLLIAIIGVLFFVNIFQKKIKIGYQALMITICFFLTIFLTMLFNSDFTGGYFVIIMSLLLGFMLIHLVPLQTFTDYYVNIMVFLGAYSILVLYLFHPIILSMPNILFPRFSNIAGVPLINARFSYIVDLNNYYRNFGIFREAGVFQVFLNIALMFELFYKKEKPSVVRVTILYITILSTFSTPGYIAAFILTCAYLFFEKKLIKRSNMEKGKKQILLLFLFLSIVTAGFYKLNNSFNRNFSLTFNKLGTQESSYQIRTNAIYSNISVWEKKPILGFGIDSGLRKEARTMIQKNLNEVSISSTDNTSTIGALLVAFGSMFTILYIYLMYKLAKQGSQNGIVKVLILLSVLITINTQLLIYNELLYVILYYGLATKNE